MDGQLAGGLTPGESRCSHVCKLTELHLPRKCRDVYTKKVKFKLVNFLTPDIVIVWGECLLERKFKVTDKFI